MSFDELHNPLFTVFTPTYNRASTLPRLYDSLLRQTVKNFEWLIVDDGSTDGTGTLVRRLQSECKKFDIRYLYQENQHKKVAHNRAVFKARGEFFIILDSDDTCVPQAIERSQFYWDSISDQNRFWCVCGLCQYANGEIIDDKFPGNSYIDLNSQEMHYKYKLKGERFIVAKTSILRNFLFREDIPGYVPEGTVWDIISAQYMTRFFNEPLRTYYQDVPGLMKRPGFKIDPRLNAPGALYSKISCLEQNLSYFRYSPRSFFMESARLTRFWLHCSSDMRRLIGYWPNSNLGKWLVLVAAPFGFCMWSVDRFRLLGVR